MSPPCFAGLRNAGNASPGAPPGLCGQRLLVFDAPRAAFTMPAWARGNLTELRVVLLVLLHLMVRDLLPGKTRTFDE